MYLLNCKSKSSLNIFTILVILFVFVMGILDLSLINTYNAFLLNAYKDLRCLKMSMMESAIALSKLFLNVHLNFSYNSPVHKFIKSSKESL